jgi:hypothetical protein
LLKPAKSLVVISTLCNGTLGVGANVGDGEFVTVGVGVLVGVTVGVLVAVAVGVLIAVGVLVSVGIGVDVLVTVGIALGDIPHPTRKTTIITKSVYFRVFSSMERHDLPVC